MAAIQLGVRRMQRGGRCDIARSARSEDAGPSRLVKRLEEILDKRAMQWPPSALRADAGTR